MRRDTIKAKKGFFIVKGHHAVTKEPLRALYDGDELLVVALPMNERDFDDEMEGNECFHIVEILTTKKGNKYYWCADEEAEVDYLVKMGGTN